MKNKRLSIILLIPALILLVPFIAMQFTTEVNWTLSDFLIAGLLLYGIGILLEMALRKIHRLKYRIVVCAALLFGLFIIWAELAVGLFGTPISGS